MYANSSSQCGWWCSMMEELFLWPGWPVGPLATWKWAASSTTLLELVPLLPLNLVLGKLAQVIIHSPYMLVQGNPLSIYKLALGGFGTKGLALAAHTEHMTLEAGLLKCPSSIDMHSDEIWRYYCISRWSYLCLICVLFVSEQNRATYLVWLSKFSKMLYIQTKLTYMSLLHSICTYSRSNISKQMLSDPEHQSQFLNFSWLLLPYRDLEEL